MPGEKATSARPVKAMVLDASGHVEGLPLKLRDVPDPQAGPSQVRTAVLVIE